MPIRFFYEGTDFKLENPRKTRRWIAESAQREGRSISDINYIFCSDKFLLGINQRFLSHNTLTDVITFDHSEGKSIGGEIYISLERVEENSSIFNSEFQDELRRVVIHGVLHLAGYNDKTPKEVA